MVKIASVEAENVKRVKAVYLEPKADGLTVIGGRNSQGKTSVLDAIAWALGGNKHKPSDAKREGAATDPQLRVVLDNGMVVERKGKSGSLKVIDPEGRKSGQMLLDGFISELAIDLPKFMAMSNKEKARELLGIIGVGDKLVQLEQQEQTLYNQRTTVGQLRDQKRGAADDMPVYPDAPADPVSAMELIERQQAILARNGENQRLRDQVPALEEEAKRHANEAYRQNQLMAIAKRQMDDAREAMEAADAALTATNAKIETARKTAEQLCDESTAEIEASLVDIEAVNAKVRSNQLHASALAEAEELSGQYKDMTEKVEAVRVQKMSLLQNADLPLPGLSVEDGALTYGGRQWDCMSGSEQLMVATAIVRKLKPDCGFVLIDKMEQMDTQTLAEFGAWAEGEGLQVIATRVSTGDECSVIIEDGRGGQAPDDDAPAPIGKPAISNPEFEAAAIDMVQNAPVSAVAQKWVMN